MSILKNKFIIYCKKKLKSYFFRFKYPGSVISSISAIDHKAKISKSVLSEGVRVGEDSKLTHTVIGRHTSIGRRCTISHVEIGSFCSISWNVTINARNHDIKKPTTSAFPYVKRMQFVSKDSIEYRRAVIGSDVWIGTGVIILEGVKVGNGAVIAAGSIVTKDVNDYEIVAGVPAKVIKMRFSENEIKALQVSKWWNWPDDKIRSNLSFFQKDFSDKVDV